MGLHKIGKALSASRPASTMAASTLSRQQGNIDVNEGTSNLVRYVRASAAANNQKGYHRASKLAGATGQTTWTNFPRALDSKLRKMMSSGAWKKISNALRGQDTRRKKSLHGGVFRRTLSRFGVALDDRELKHLRHKFGTASHARSKKQLSIDYVAFLNHYSIAQSKSLTRSRSAVGMRRSARGGIRRTPSGRLTRTASAAAAVNAGATYDPSARQFETSLTAHVRKALQIANAPADRRALKAALASARSGAISGRSTARSSMSGSSR